MTLVHRRSLRAAAGLAALALVPAGCGASGSSTATTGPATAASRTGSTPARSTATPARTTTTPGRVGEVNPAGDIPDNQAYVTYALPRGAARFKVPEGWSRVTAPGYVVFTDKLNAIRAELRPPVSPRADLARLSHTVPGFRPGTTATVQRPAGRVVRLDYLARSAANPVTGKRATDAVERYLFTHGGRQLVLTLSGPQGADNVDPWRIVTSSVRFTR